MTAAGGGAGVPALKLRGLKLGRSRRSLLDAPKAGLEPSPAEGGKINSSDRFPVPRLRPRDPFAAGRDPRGECLECSGQLPLAYAPNARRLFCVVLGEKAMSMIFPSRITIRLSALVMAVSSASNVDAQDIRGKPARSAFIAATMLLTILVITSQGACAQSAVEKHIADGPMLLADFNEDEQQRLNPQQLRPFTNEYEHQQHQQQELQQPRAR